MEPATDYGIDYNDVVEQLIDLFGNVMTKEVLLAVVESCAGNLNAAAEAIISMSNDVVDNTTTAASEASTPHLHTLDPTTSSQPLSLNQSVAPDLSVQLRPTMSYAGLSRNTGAVPKQALKPRVSPIQSIVWTDLLRKIMSYHNQGTRTLIIMRGVPGSGKSYMAKQIVEMLIGASYNDYKNHIFSTDDFFMIRGQYRHDKSRLSIAHDWNQSRVRQALREGVSPVIVDNTNIEIWEMEPYVRDAVRNGYIIEVVEPNTPWAKKANQCLRKCTHNVPITSIMRMLSNYQDGVTGTYLLKFYGLSYPGDKVPPVIRNTPEYCPPQTSNVHDVPKSDEETQVTPMNVTKMPEKSPITNATEHTERIVPIEIETEQEQLARKSRELEIQKQIEEIEKVEKDWEHGENWSDESQEAASHGNYVPFMDEPKPPRTISDEASGQSTQREDLLKTVQKCEDWRKFSFLLPSWADESVPAVEENVIVPETQSTGTCVEFGDTNMPNPNKVLKVISACPRDINLFTMPVENEKMPVVRMFDKSTMTNEILITEAYRCKNEEQHFKAFRKLFKTIPREALRDVFDKCCGDVNWAVDIVLGGLAEIQMDSAGTQDISDTEEEIVQSLQCNCLSAYQIIPDTDISTSSTMVDQLNIPTNSTELNLQPQKKPKTVPSESTLKLKSDFEKNIVIGDSHYSEHVLNLRKYRRGELNVPIRTEDVPKIDLDSQPCSSKDIVTEDEQQYGDAVLSDDEDSTESNSSAEVERTVNINVGFGFIKQIDMLFGRQGIVYPETVLPRINIPISLLNEINAFWMESLMTQLDDQQRQGEKMLKEDEDFARQLEMKEAELARQGRQPEIPDFKEIMDMDFAIALYQRDVAEWKSKEPTDMAAKLSRDKLYNLFPDMSPEVLSELLMAHENNFQATVEVLLMSTGKANILEEKNGLNKFVMEKEMERQERLLEEEKKALSEVEWPLLPKGEKVDLSAVESYREEADKHLTRRNMNYQKAQEYIRRGMTQVANHYSELASFHKMKFEQANSLAAASLMQLHASKSSDNATIDLHYLRVGEAKESLDLFLDTHIQKLREAGHSGVRCNTLFFITGRGKHSSGRPRVKPAVKKRLRERELVVRERNPGLLTAKVCAEDKLSYQVPPVGDP